MSIFSNPEKKQPTDRDKSKACYNFFLVSMVGIALGIIFGQYLATVGFIVVAILLSSCSAEYELRYLREKVEKNG